MIMHDEDLNSPALWSYADDAQFNERLAALATYRELRERRWRRTMQPGDRERLRAAREVLERTGGIPATWQDTR
jgi:predicted component of type VI protein secretion system